MSRFRDAGKRKADTFNSHTASPVVSEHDAANGISFYNALSRRRVMADSLRERSPSLSLTIADMVTIAAAREGRCLSTEYVNNRTPLEWECARGHRWWASACNVKRGTWCRLCGFERMRGCLTDVQAAAAKRGGRCLSQVYVDNATPLLFECSAGHRWEAKPSAVMSGRWCGQCRYAQQRIPIEQLRDFAASHGGQCLSEAHTRYKEKLRWRCANGHEWEATTGIVSRGQWCRECARERCRLGIDRMRAIAADRGGKCLSENYINANKSLQWQCAEGHVWTMTAVRAKQGRWCPYCGGRRHSLAEMQELARSRGGECVSDTYVAIHRKLEWRCGKGHTWWTKPAVVIQGHWCPDCAILERTVNERKKRRHQALGLLP